MNAVTPLPAVSELARLIGTWRLTLWGGSFLPDPEERVDAWLVHCAWIEDGAAPAMHQGGDDHAPPAARATAVVVGASCPVFTNVEAAIAITVRGLGHWSICDKIVHLGKGLYDVGLGGDFDIHLYTRDCADRYAGDAITVYDNGGSPAMVARACRAFLRHRLPVLDGNAR